MKTKKQIEEKIKEIEADERYKASPAVLDVNAPLALIQIGMESQVRALKWVLRK